MCAVSSDRVVATILFSGFWTRHLDRLVDTAEWTADTADTATLTAPRPGCPRSRCCPAAGGSPSCRCRPGRRCRWRPWWRWRSRACWRGSCPSPRSTSCSPPGCRGWPTWGRVRGDSGLGMSTFKTFSILKNLSEASWKRKIINLTGIKNWMFPVITKHKRASCSIIKPSSWILTSNHRACEQSYNWKSVGKPILSSSL